MTVRVWLDSLSAPSLSLPTRSPDGKTSFLLLYGRQGVCTGGGRVVYGGDVDGEGLLGAGVRSAVQRATVVAELHGNSRTAVGVRCGLVGELAIGVDLWLSSSGEQVGVTGGLESQPLAILVGAASRDVGSPTVDLLRPESSFTVWLTPF